MKRDKITYDIDTVKRNVEVSEGLATTVKDMKKKLGKDMPISFDFAGDISVQTTEITEQEGKRTFTKVVVVSPSSWVLSRAFRLVVLIAPSWVEPSASISVVDSRPKSVAVIAPI